MGLVDNKHTRFLNADDEDADQTGGCTGWSESIAGNIDHYVIFDMLWLIEEVKWFKFVIIDVVWIL